MSFKDLVKQNLRQLEQKYDAKVDGVHIYDESKVFKRDRLFDGTIIDWRGDIKQNYSYKYISTLCPKGYLAQKNTSQNK